MQNPPRYFPPHYFDDGYWGGQQVEGAISANLGGGSSLGAEISFVSTEVATGGGRKRRSNYAYLDAKPVQTKPVFIEAKLGGTATFESTVAAIADLQSAFVGKSGFETTATAIADMGAGLGGGASFGANGETVKIVITVDRWAQAREEEEFWLLAA